MSTEFLELLETILAQNGYRSCLVTRFDGGYRHHARVIEIKDKNAEWYKKLLGLDYTTIGTLDYGVSYEHEFLTLSLSKDYLYLSDDLHRLLKRVIDDAIFLAYVGPSTGLTVKMAPA